METNEVIDAINPFETRDKFAKLVLGTAAGFVAAKVTENVYDVIVAWRRSRSETTE